MRVRAVCLPDAASVACASLLGLVWLAGCGGSSTASPGDPDTGVVDDSGSPGNDATPGNDAAPPGNDSGNPPPVDAGVDQWTPPPGDSGDGTPSHGACTRTLGAGMDTSYGRLDGYLSAIVPAGGCNTDSAHLHLQVKMSGGIYDIAVNLDPLFYEADMAIPDGPWAEGWHTGITLNYASLGVHSGQFTQLTPAALRQKIEAELATVNHIAVFATGYGPTGGHDVHRSTNVPSHDGALVLDPLSATPHLLFFHFSNQTF